MLRCPRCSDVLSRKRVAGIELDGCHACGGAFFDKGELTALAKEPQNLLAVDAAFRPVQAALKPASTNTCPKCLTAMSPFEQPSLPGIQLDACPTCRGIWLDGGEAAEIARRRGVSAPVAAPAPVASAPEPAPVQLASAPAAGGLRPEQQRAFAVAGLVALVFIVVAGHSMRLLTREHAQGHVVRIDRTRYSRNSGSSHALVQFATASGGVHTLRESLWGLELMREGDSVTVLYSRDDPEDAALGTFWGLWGWPLFILVFGSTLVLRMLGLLQR